MTQHFYRHAAPAELFSQLYAYRHQKSTFVAVFLPLGRFAIKTNTFTLETDAAFGFFHAVYKADVPVTMQVLRPRSTALSFRYLPFSFCRHASVKCTEMQFCLGAGYLLGKIGEVMICHHRVQNLIANELYSIFIFRRLCNSSLYCTIWRLEIRFYK